MKQKLSHRRRRINGFRTGAEADTTRTCFASVEMGQTACSNKLQFRAEVSHVQENPETLHGSGEGRHSSAPSPRAHPVSDLCDQHGIHPTMFYRWQKEFFENAAAAFEPRSRRAADANERRIALLEQKLQRKHEVLSELMEEHIKLKKELGEL